jgi:hypothetical protein
VGLEAKQEDPRRPWDLVPAPRPDGTAGVHNVCMAAEASYLEPNRSQLARLRSLLEGLSDDDLQRRVNEHWTVADSLGHMAFWDARVSVLSAKLERGVPFSASDAEPEDVDWINDAALPLIHAIPPGEVARLALRLAEQADAAVARLDPRRLWPDDPNSPINPLRAAHRGEHLDEIEAALRGG